MATLHGSVGAFDSETEDWSTYVQRLDFYFASNDVTTKAKKRSILLANCGPATFKLVRSLAETELKSTPYATLIQLLQDYYEPKPSEIVQRISQQPGESIATYVAALREIATDCNYDDKLKENLRDQLVKGVANESIWRKLLAEKNLTYDKAFSLAQAIDASEWDSKQMRGPKSSGTQALLKMGC